MASGVEGAVGRNDNVGDAVLVRGVATVNDLGARDEIEDGAVDWLRSEGTLSGAEDLRLNSRSKDKK